MSQKKDPDPEFQQQPIDVWKQKAFSPLSSEAVREIRENLSGFFQTLLMWDQANRRALDSSGVAASEKKQQMISFRPPNENQPCPPIVTCLL
jgi:hypothetical protein